MNYLNSIYRTFFISLSLLFVINACTELEENPGAVQLAPGTLTSVETLEALITGMYRTVQNEARWSNFFIAGYSGDDITTFSGGNKVGFREADWRAQTPASDRLVRAYRGAYNMIAIANTAINAKEAIEGDREIIDRLIGETHFMRAFAYLHLTRTYGEVPVQLNVNDPQILRKASFQELYELIEADLLEAERLLPDVYPGIQATGIRPSKGAAKAFLARLYMHWAGFPLNESDKYGLAATKSKEVIDGGFGYDLSPSLRSMWTVGNRFAHSEGVFTMVFCDEVCGTGNRTTGRLGLPLEAKGWSETFGEIAFFEDMEAAAMAEGTTTRFEDTYVLEVLPRGDEPNGAEWRNFDIEPHPILRKVVGGDMSEVSVVNSTNNAINRYFMRYADVLLTYAEASGRSGNSSTEAWEALNKVRRRAAGLDPNIAAPSIDITSGDLAELAFTERKWELAGEFERWHDLVRTNRVVEAFANRSPDEAVDVVNSKTPETSGKYLYFSPIPQAELDNSPQLND